MVSLSSASLDRNARLHAELQRRNRLVAMLRVGVPVLGALVFAGLVLQLFFASLVQDLGFASFTVDRDRVVVEAPRYAAMSNDGTSYEVVASSAAAVLGRTDLIDLTDVVLTLRTPEDVEMRATAEEAQLQTHQQLVTVDGVTHVAEERGTHGTLHGVVADVPNETVRANGAVDLTFGNGATLEGTSMHYAGGGVWHFTDVTLVLPGTPGAEAAAAGSSLPDAERRP